MVHLVTFILWNKLPQCPTAPSPIRPVEITNDSQTAERDALYHFFLPNMGEMHTVFSTTRCLTWDDLALLEGLHEAVHLFLCQ